MRILNKSKRHNGQGMTEYIIIVALIAIAAIAIVETFGQTLRVQIGRITSSMQGTSYKGKRFQKVSGTKTGEKTLKDYTKK